jgi:hypothetical protein
VDDDGDGVPTCHDGCPEDPNKTEPGVCGCGETETEDETMCSGSVIDSEPPGGDSEPPGGDSEPPGGDSDPGSDDAEPVKTSVTSVSTHGYGCSVTAFSESCCAEWWPFGVLLLGAWSRRRRSEQRSCAQT